ncbi:MAG: valine--tRNA ligase [Patescibacteria group bacterium]|nr:valine--tRNA ligase [Patescibacteria group bacterium]
MKEISKHYDPSETEPRWLKFWEKEGIYKFDPRAKGEIFSIDTPPPYVSGRMHVGHASSFSQEDFVARYQKMRGKNIFHPFGTDDNGLPTERLVEKTYNVKATKMKRGDFIRLCNKMLSEMTPEFIEDWKDIGMSCDFSKMYSTIDDHSREISQWHFIDLYKKQRVYRQEAPVIWCPHCQTAIAQADLEDKESKTFFSNLVFKLKNGKGLIISTTRPELLSSCVAIFVHPRDLRYKRLVGQKAKVPLFNYWVEIKTDKKVDMKKGSGAVMCCTFGDKTDVEWFKEYKLPLKVSLDAEGKLTKLAKKYANLSIKEARSRIIEDLKTKKLLTAQKEISHTVNIHERCKTEIEILNSKQWFIRYLDKKNELIELGRKIEWHPPFMRSRYENWVKGLSWDWAISRQRFFGVSFPVWYCQKCGEVKLAEEKDLPVDPLADKPKGKCGKCGGSKFSPEKDVMDTWATSSLTPQLALQLFYGEKETKKMIPMSLRPQAHDIISTWLFYTVVRSNFHLGKLPWNRVMISGYVTDPNGRKMSKSLGNVISPKVILEKYGADALRLWAAGRSVGQDLNYSEEEIQAGKKFLTKLWNVTRFVMMNLSLATLEKISKSYFSQSGKKEPNKDAILNKVVRDEADKWILAELQELVDSATKSFENYDYSSAKLAIEKFFWIKLADNYIEIVKNRLYDESPKNKKGRESAQFTLYTVLLTLLRLLAPFIPFATEEIYQTFFKTNKTPKSIHLCDWPEANKKLADKKRVEFGKILLKIVGQIRKHKAERGLSMKTEIKKLEIFCDGNIRKSIEEIEGDLKAVGNIGEIKFKKSGKLRIKISDFKA